MHRHERFSAEYLQRVEALLNVIIPYILCNYKEKEVETRELNKSLANFLKVFLLKLC